MFSTYTSKDSDSDYVGLTANRFSSSLSVSTARRLKLLLKNGDPYKRRGIATLLGAMVGITRTMAWYIVHPCVWEAAWRQKTNGRRFGARREELREK